MKLQQLEQPPGTGVCAMKGRGGLDQGLLTPTATKEGSEGVRFPLEPLQTETLQSPWDESDIQHPDFTPNGC